jgi:fimbrial chaperone protein
MLLPNLRQGAFLLAFLMAAGHSRAGSFAVSPVRVTLTASAPIVAITVRNDGSEPTVVQIDTTRWTQQDATDRYEPTRDLIATPPIFTVPANGSQVVRIGLRRAPDAQHELTYRLYLTEVPGPPPPDLVGARVALRLGVPVFVTPSVAGAQTLSWHMERAANGAVAITCTNRGSVHARITNLKLSPPDGAPPIVQQVAADIHAGQQRTWVLRSDQIPPAGTTLRLSAMTERGDASAELIVP